MTKDEIKEVRVKAGLTQKQLAQLLGTTVTTVSRWEQGKSKPLPTFLKRLKKTQKSQKQS